MAEKPAQTSTNVSSSSNAPSTTTTTTTQEPYVAAAGGGRDRTVSDAYRLKSDLVSKAFSDMGMGRYQWQLLLVTGFGWATDNMLIQGLSLSLTPVALEFEPARVSYLVVAFYVGLTIGATIWGVNCDIIGRRPAFNITLFISGIFCCAAAASPNFETCCALWALAGVGAGGGVPVDLLIFLEFVPPGQQWLLTLLSAMWSVGQIVAAVAGWPLLLRFSCAAGEEGGCRREDNLGWRYMLITLGGLVLLFAVVRIAVFGIPESPRYLLAVGDDAGAVAAVDYVARKNGKVSPLALADLEAVDRRMGIASAGEAEKKKKSVLGVVVASVKDYRGQHIRALFSTRGMGFHCTVLWTIWAAVGISFPLYFSFLPSYLAARFTTTSTQNDIYKNYLIVSIVGLAGPFLAGYLIETRLGRRWAMALAFTVSGVFLFLYTMAASEAADLGFQCAVAILGNFSYAVLYTYTAESFPAPHRGTGNGIASCLVRIMGMFAPLISANTGFTTVPIYVSAGLWVLCGALTCCLRFETYGGSAI
ncbi:major facilitator superfamily domain-containing protein [Morchella snyderi]|nr:major facilitator superfamily domain-containing protein [Morchella snyderi]